MRVNLFDLKRLLHPIKSELLSSAESSINKSNFILGEDVSSFENSFSKKVEANHCLGVSSGTDALLAIFMALDIPKGSEILVPSFTFVASATSIVRAGFKPVFIDIKKDGFVASKEEVLEKWTDNTKAVLFVHLFGEYTDLSEIKSFCDSRSAYLIEDCAQSFGVKPGVQGHASAYSFFPAKNLGCLGDGGAVLTDDVELAAKIKMIRQHGSAVKYTYELIGGNFRLDSMQAGFLNVLLNHVDGWLAKRKENANIYSSELSGIDGLTLPGDSPFHSWNQYTLRTNRRDELKEFLDKNSIGSAIYYPNPIHLSKIFECKEVLERTEDMCKKVISIPVYPGLLKDEQNFVINKIKEFYNAT